MRLGLVLVGIALYAIASAAPRAGKVVKIERRPSGLSGTPRYCSVSTTDLLAYCVSEKGPEVGDRLTVIDSQRVLGVLRVTHVQPLGDGCQQNMLWMTQSVLDSGKIDAPQGQMIATLDVPVDTRTTRLIHVDKSPGGHSAGIDTIYAIDRNGDGTPDLEFVQFPCDDTGNPTINSTGTCFEVWAQVPGRGLEKLRSERQKQCY